jgi:hypothetical protein
MRLLGTAYRSLWKETHGAIFYLGAASEAGIVSVAPVDNLPIGVAVDHGGSSNLRAA